MNNVQLLVNVAQAGKHLGGNARQHGLWQRPTQLNQIAKRAAVHTLEHNVHISLAVEGAVKLDNAVVPRRVQRPKFKQNGWPNRRRNIHGNNFERNLTPSWLVNSSSNTATASLAELFEQFQFIETLDQEPSTARRAGRVR
jgi:hypothetical protein